MFKDMCSQGIKIIIDCEFDELMKDTEKKSMAQQLAYVHNINKTKVKPCSVLVSGISKGSVIDEKMKQNCAHNWAGMQFTEHSYQEWWK